MTPQVKAALIIAGAIIIATALWIYFSPFQTCMRLEHGTFVGCARLAAGGGD